jgi:TRAP-type transport system periplasmic protein
MWKGDGGANGGARQGSLHEERAWLCVARKSGKDLDHRRLDSRAVLLDGPAAAYQGDHSMNAILRTLAVGCLALGAATTPTYAANWDMPMAWPANNFHVKNAERFAVAVSEATGGEVQITVHPGGSLGFKGPEMLKSVRDGLVPMGDILLNQQVGDAPFLGIESVPYLASGYEEIAALHEFSRPVYEAIAAEFNQKILYMVPWPGQGVYSKNEIVTLADVEGLPIRVVDKNGLDFMRALGAAPRQMPWGDVVPALASGAISGVTTSSSSGVDGKFWEFMGFLNRFNWQSASNMVTVNLDAWNALSPEHRAAIEQVAADLEPQFWEVSRQEDELKLAELAQNGMKITEPTPELRAQLLEKALPMWDAFIAEVGEPAGTVVAAYRAKTGK